VRKKMLILRRQKCVNDAIRNLAVLNGDATLLADLRHQAPITCIDSQRDLQMNVFKTRDFRQARGEDEVGGC